MTDHTVILEKAALKVANGNERKAEELLQEYYEELKAKFQDNATK